MPWVLAGVVGLGLIAFLLRRRRRADEEVYYEEAYEAPQQAVEPVHETVAPIAAAPLAVAPVMAAEPVTETGRPDIDLEMQPLRAGVTGDQAVVEFALKVDNNGSAPARDVRISTWMFPAGVAESEVERLLIKGREPASLPQVEAGGAHRLSSSVALPTAGIGSDSVLPVVVAEARYRLADGSEARTAATFAVGVPLEGELAHFDVENPSGLHEGVEAWQLGETERA